MAKTVKKSESKATGKAGGDKVAKSADAKGANVKKASAKGAPAKRQRSRGSAKGAKKGGFGKFLRDVRVELSKVTWPTRPDLIQSTIVVIVAVAIVATYVGGLDVVFNEFMKLIHLSN